MKMKGESFSIVTSVLMMIGGAVGIINGVIAVLGAGALAAAVGTTASFGLLMFGSVLVWGSGTAELIAGVTGMKRAAKPEKAVAYLAAGILAAVLTALGNVLIVSGGGSINVLSLVSGLALPVSCLLCERRARDRR